MMTIGSFSRLPAAFLVCTIYLISIDMFTDYLYAWDDCYTAHPADRSSSDVLAWYNDDADGGFTFDGHQYHAWGSEPQLPEPHDYWESTVPCPGPQLPPLQGPSERDCGTYWATRFTAFVYDEAAELALREQQREYRRQERLRAQRLSAPGYYWCEFA